MLELGMSFSLEQLVIDDVINGLNYFPYNGIDVNEKTLAVDSIMEVGAGGDFLGVMDTLMNIDLGSNPPLINREMFETWKRGGEKSLTDVAHDRVVEILKNEPQRTPLSSWQRAEMDWIIKESDKKVV